MIVYKVEIKPLQGDETYPSTWTDISDYVDASGISKIKKEIDATDYSIGVYTLSDITLKAKNLNGIFNEADHRSIFPNGRDLAIVKVSFSQIDNQGIATDTTRFEGILNEEATRLDTEDSEIRFKVLAKDSVLRKNKVSGGAVSSGQTVSAALGSILNVPDVTKVLNFSSANINPDLDVVIDDGSSFDNATIRDAVNELLLISNSVLLLDASDNIIVKSRQENSLTGFLPLYGPGDIFGRENIIRVKSFNSGKHRTFTSFKVNNTVFDKTGFSEAYGFQQKSLSIDSITDDAKELSIATRLTEEFKYPKQELEVEVKTLVAKNHGLLDTVQMNYPFQLRRPKEGNFYPIVGVTKIGDASDPLPQEYGPLMIDSNIAFKIIGITENVKKFTTTLKLRQTGTETFDGIFNRPESAIVGFAVIGTAVLQADTTEVLKQNWNPAIVGATKINGLAEVL